MQDMISKIIKIDEEARKKTEEVKSSIQRSEEEVQKYRLKIQTEYLDRARKRIERNRITEQKISDKQLQQIQDEHQNIFNNLDVLTDKNFDQWVQDIKQRVIGE